ncbi:MAG: hypothetical protein JNG84_09770, partial [Archangium sp.]|nr:hypothetical protein [Archangium sp.]
MFGWLRGKKPEPKRVAPLATFDGVIASFERQASEIRKSAATLLALRASLSADLARDAQRRAGLESRLAEAQQQKDALLESTFLRDIRDTTRRQAETEAALETAKNDAQLLIEAAERVQATLSELKTERA